MADEWREWRCVCGALLARVKGRLATGNGVQVKCWRCKAYQHWLPDSPAADLEAQVAREALRFGAGQVATT